MLLTASVVNVERAQGLEEKIQLQKLQGRPVFDIEMKVGVIDAVLQHIVALQCCRDACIIFASSSAVCIVLYAFAVCVACDIFMVCVYNRSLMIRVPLCPTTARHTVDC